MAGYARTERAALADTLLAAGPDAPTLCGGWTAADLAAHLVIRESRPDAAAGIIVRPLAQWTARVQGAARDRTPYPQLIERVRSGPPAWSPTRITAVDEAANTVEFFVHHEDVRRAQPGWEPRKIDQGLSEVLWHRLGMAKFILRKAPVGVELVRDDEPGPTESGVPRIRITAKARTPVVTITGPPAELTMWAFGRTAAARVRLDGSEAAIGAIKTANWQI